MIGYKFGSNVLEANTIHYNNTKHYGGLVMELAFFRPKPQNAYRRQLRACTYCKPDFHDLAHPNRLNCYVYEQYTFTAYLLTFFFSYEPI